MFQMGAHVGSGPSNAFITGLLLLLVKLFTVFLFVAVVVGIGVWIKNSFFQSSNSSLSLSVNNDPVVKMVLTTVLAIIGLVVLFTLLKSFTGSGVSIGLYGQLGGYNSLGSGLSGLITLLIKLMSVVLVIALVAAAVTCIKKQFDSETKNVESTVTVSELPDKAVAE